jgi:hypothetical protein
MSMTVKFAVGYILFVIPLVAVVFRLGRSSLALEYLNPAHLQL